MSLAIELHPGSVAGDLLTRINAQDPRYEGIRVGYAEPATTARATGSRTCGHPFVGKDVAGYLQADSQPGEWWSPAKLPLMVLAALSVPSLLQARVILSAEDTGILWYMVQMEAITRFRTALILKDVVSEMPATKVVERWFPNPRESTQSKLKQLEFLQEDTSFMAYQAAGFCERMGWNDLAGLISLLQVRGMLGN
jgi:hypothetical protein